MVTPCTLNKVQVSPGKMNPTHPSGNSKNSESECIPMTSARQARWSVDFFNILCTRDLVDRHDTVRGALKSLYADEKFIFGRVRKKIEIFVVRPKGLQISSYAESNFILRRMQTTSSAFVIR